MEPLEEDEIYDAVRQRRMSQEIRDDLIRELSGKSERNLPQAVFLFALAIGTSYFAYSAANSATANLGGDGGQGSDLPLIWSLLALACVWGAYRSLVPDPRNRFLLLLAKEAILKGDETLKADEKNPAP